MTSDDKAPRVLVLVRHGEAKSRAADGDRARPLTKAGRAAARAVGERLAADGVRADLVVASPAVRTVETADALIEGGLRAEQVWGDEALYDADVEEVLDSIREVPDDVRRLVVVGHAPGLPMVAAEVADHTETDPDVLRRRIDAWATAGWGVIVHDGPWAAFPDDSSALVLLCAGGD